MVNLDKKNTEREREKGEKNNEVIQPVIMKSGFLDTHVIFAVTEKLYLIAMFQCHNNNGSGGASLSRVSSVLSVKSGKANKVFIELLPKQTWRQSWRQKPLSI